MSSFMDFYGKSQNSRMKFWKYSLHIRYKKKEKFMVELFMQLNTLIN